MAVTAKLDQDLEAPGVQVVLPFRLQRRDRDSADALQLAAHQCELDPRRPLVALNELDLDAEQPPQRSRKLGQRSAGAGAAGSDDYLFGEQVIELGDAGMIPYPAHADDRVHVADPGELRGIEAPGRLAKQRLEGGGVSEVCDHGAVLRGHIVEPVRRRETRDTDHVLRNEIGIAGNETAHVPRQHATIEVEAGPHLVPDHDGDFAAGIEALDLSARLPAGRRIRRPAPRLHRVSMWLLGSWSLPGAARSHNIVRPANVSRVRRQGTVTSDPHTTIGGNRHERRRIAQRFTATLKASASIE